MISILNLLFSIRLTFVFTNNFRKLLKLAAKRVSELGFEFIDNISQLKTIDIQFDNLIIAITILKSNNKFYFNFSEEAI